jgi:hypothetical protein
VADSNAAHRGEPHARGLGGKLDVLRAGAAAVTSAVSFALGALLPLLAMTPTQAGLCAQERWRGCPRHGCDVRDRPPGRDLDVTRARAAESAGSAPARPRFEAARATGSSREAVFSASVGASRTGRWGAPRTRRIVTFGTFRCGRCR